MKLIKEHTETVNYLIEEDKETGKKNYNIEGVFLQADIKNRNGRIYTVVKINMCLIFYQNGVGCF